MKFYPLNLINELFVNQNSILLGGGTSMKLVNNGMGTLTQIADSLWRDMNEEIARNGHSDLTLGLEGAVYGIREIVELNNIED
jgi:hypothetical protein